MSVSLYQALPSNSYWFCRHIACQCQTCLPINFIVSALHVWIVKLTQLDLFYHSAFAGTRFRYMQKNPTPRRGKDPILQ